MDGSPSGRVTRPLARRSRPLSGYRTSHVSASPHVQCSTDVASRRWRFVRCLPLASVGALIPTSVRAADCPRPNQRTFESYVVVTSKTATGTWEPPTLKKQTKPKYPGAAMKDKLEGTVVVELLIDENGCVAATKLVQSVPIFDKAAIECVVKWRFTPARHGGAAVATIAQSPVHFRFY